MQVDSAVPVEGFELPLVTTVTVRNPNVSSGAGIHRFEVACYERDETLAGDEVRITPPTTSALVTRRALTPYDHQITVRYDAQGAITEQVETYGNTDSISAPLVASVQTWRNGGLWMVGLMGAFTAVAWLLRGRSHGTAIS